MGIIQSISEGLSVKNLASLFYTGWTQTSPGQTRVEPTHFSTQLNSKYNFSITDAFTGGDPRTSTLANILATMYTETYRTKKELFELYKSVKDLDQASVIISDMIDDAMNTPDSDYPFTVKLKGDYYNKSGLEEKVQDFIKKFDIYQLDRDTAEDFLVLGDYYFTTLPEAGRGIVEVYDNVDVENVFSLYKNNHLEQHIGMDKNSMFSNSPVSGYAGQLRPIHPDLLSHFTLDSRKIKIKLPIPDASILALPEHIRIGRSVLFSSLQLLKKYQLLDMALTYKEVRNALMPVLLGVSTGAFTTPDNMIEACKSIESYLADGTAMSFDIDNSSTIEDMLQNSTGFKVAPVPGDKGQLNKIDVGQGTNETEGLSKILSDTGERIAIAAGGVSRNDEGKSRLEVLKNNSRRSKRLVDIQAGRSRGWRDMIHKHLRYQHINIDKENIQVDYKAIPNADVFEESQGLISLLSVINDLQTFSDSVKQSNSGYRVNPKKMVDAFNMYVGSRYPAMKEFLELDITKNAFPAATDALKNADKIQVSTGNSGRKVRDNKEDEDLEISDNDSKNALGVDRGSFPGSNGSSDATGM